MKSSAGLFLFLVGLTGLSSACEITLPAYYHEGMVFQAGGSAKAWGFTTCTPEEVVVDVLCEENGIRTVRYMEDRKLFTNRLHIL